MWGDEATDSFLKLLSGCQLRQQFLVDAAEAAVAHNQNVVACLGGSGDAVHKIIKLLADVCLAAQGGERGGNVPIHAACVAKHLVGIFQAACKGGGHGAEFHGVGARL